jgi:hypothetical protein
MAEPKKPAEKPPQEINRSMVEALRIIATADISPAQLTRLRDLARATLLSAGVEV